MDREAFTRLMAAKHEELLRINQTKGVEYAGEADALDNFKRHAAELGLRPTQVWAVYAAKHWDAIISYVRRGEVLSDEGIEGRIDDAILYLYLLLGLVSEADDE